MRIACTLILTVFVFAEAAWAQVTTGKAASLTRDNAKVLTDLRNTLSPEQLTAVARLQGSQTQNKVCPTCTTVDDGQMAGHALGSPEPDPSQKHLVMPVTEEARLNQINAVLWTTLNALKGSDKKYMDQYQAYEAAHAPTTLEQIALRSKFVNDLISRLAQQGGQDTCK